MIPFAGNKDVKLFLVRLRYRHCCVSIIMRPSGYFVAPNLAHGAIWVWDSWAKWCWAFIGQNCIHFKTRKNFFLQLPQNPCFEILSQIGTLPGSVHTSAVMALVWQLYRLLVNLPNFRLVLANSFLPYSSSVCLNFYHKWRSQLEGYPM